MRCLAFIALPFLLATIARAQDVPAFLSRFAIHGYLSQAFAISADRPILGIPTNGTADYRDVAVQLRYDHNRRNNAVIQLRHLRLGDSAREGDDVELDWAFVEHDVSDRLSLKAGRIPLPLGIFNEAGGPAGGSPFFRPPGEFYERHYSSKTLDGALASMSFGKSGGWSGDVDAYGGRWDVDYRQNERADARDAWGAQFWANTPRPGVRFGGGAYRCDVYAPNGEESEYLMLHASVEADLDRWLLASEFIRGNLDSTGRYRAWYAQAGYAITPKVSVHARTAIARIRVPSRGRTIDADLSQDLALAVNVAVTPSVLLKVEGHTNDGLLAENGPADYYEPTSRTRYLIASVTLTY